MSAVNRFLLADGVLSKRQGTSQVMEVDHRLLESNSSLPTQVAIIIAYFGVRGFTKGGCPEVVFVSLA